MVRILEDKMVGGGVIPKHYVEIACLSSDTKPTEGIAQGSICLELNGSTLNVYMFNESLGDWIEIGGSSGGDPVSPTPNPVSPTPT